MDDLSDCFKNDKTNYFVRSGVAFEYINKNIDKHSKILELGCGYGVLAKTLLENGYKDLTLIDIDDYRGESVKGKTNFHWASVVAHSAGAGGSVSRTWRQPFT